jgi:hypothetical protein
MKTNWKRYFVGVLVILAIATVADALSCSQLAHRMFTSSHPVYWAKRYYKAGCGDFDLVGMSTTVPMPDVLPWDDGDSEAAMSDKEEQTHLDRSIEAFTKKDYKTAIEHAKQHTDEHVVLRIVGVSSCALKDKDGVREALAKSDEDGKELIKFACNHYKAAVE